MAQQIKLTVFPSGFGYASSPDGPVVRFRVADRGGRLVMTEVHLGNPDGVDVEQMREAPVSRIEAALNAPELADQVRSKIAAGEKRGATEADHAMKAAAPLTDRSLPQITPHDLDVPEALSAHMDRRAYRIKGAAKRPKPDGFYERVAEVYGQAAAATRSPAQELARANGVPATTVHGWVKEARRRGLLAPGERHAGDARFDRVQQVAEDVAQGPLGRMLDDFTGHSSTTDHEDEGADQMKHDPSGSSGDEREDER